MENTTHTLRRELMRQRDEALKSGDIARFQKLTTRIAALPMRGVPALTKRDIDRYARRNDNG